MHRGFFAKAMSDYPSDPLSAKYGHSVLRAHESASFFVTLVRSLWLQQRDLAERNWFLFTHVFSCAVSDMNIRTNINRQTHDQTRLFLARFLRGALAWLWHGLLYKA